MSFLKRKKGSLSNQLYNEVALYVNGTRQTVLGVINEKGGGNIGPVPACREKGGPTVLDPSFSFFKKVNRRGSMKVLCGIDDRQIEIDSIESTLPASYKLKLLEEEHKVIKTVHEKDLASNPQNRKTERLSKMSAIRSLWLS